MLDSSKRASDSSKRAGGRGSRRERAQQSHKHEHGKHECRADLLGARRPDHRPGGYSLKKNVIRIGIRWSGYSAGNGMVGLDVRIAFLPDSVKALTSDGLATVTSVTAAVLVDDERNSHMAVHRHRRLGNHPVQSNLREEPRQPRAELHALRIELDGFAEVLVVAAAEVGEVVLLRVLRKLRIAWAITPTAGPRSVGQRRVGRSLRSWWTRRKRRRRLRGGGRLWWRGRRRGPESLRGVAARERHRIGRTFGTLDGPRPAIEVGQVSARRHLWRRHIELRLDEHESRPIAFSLFLTFELRAQLLVHRFLSLLDDFAHERQARPEQDRDAVPTREC